MTDLPIDIDARLAAARHLVLRRVRRRRRATTAIAAGALLVAAGGATGATLVVQQLTAHEAATSVVCYSHDDLGSLTAGGAMADAVASDGTVTTPTALDKREACELAWRGGLAVQAAGGHPKVDPYTGLGDYAVPPLAFCVLADGGTGGFPIERPSTTTAEVCARLGLPVDPGVAAS